MYAWGKKGKMLLFTGVYVCVKAKLTLVSFFPCFFCTFPLEAYFFIEGIAYYMSQDAKKKESMFGGHTEVFK